MKLYNTVAFSFGPMKEAALYFDFIIPFNSYADYLSKAADLPPILPPEEIAPKMIPDNLRAKPNFAEMFLCVDIAFGLLLQKKLIENFGLPARIEGIGKGEYAKIELTAGKLFYEFMKEFSLENAPIVFPNISIPNSDSESDDIAVTISSLHLIDVSKTTWEQIAEFRQDKEAKKKLRHLRLFAFENYAGKSRAYIEDDLYSKISEYNEQVRRWGFETKYSVITTLLNSKTLASAFGGSLISTLFDSPITAVASAAFGLAVEIGKISFEISHKRFELRNVLKDNPVSYINDAKTKLE